MSKSISFQDALKKSSDKKILLLGNGFSLAKDQAFNYASNPSMEGIRKKVIDDLCNSLKEINGMTFTGLSIERPVYALNRELSKNVHNLKRELVDLVARHHPDPGVVNDLTAGASINSRECVNFLSHFIGKSKSFGQIYTLNYDLMLYWVLMHDLDREQDPPEGERLSFNDGFSGTASTGLTWNSSNDEQNIFFLHGALHLKFQMDPFLLIPDLGKFVYSDSPILIQIRKAISNDEMPLLVLEGESSHKRDVIRNDPYLAHGFSEFIKALDDSKTSLFIFGCSLSEVDEHIRKVILKGNCKVLCSTYGTPPKGKTGAFCTHCKEYEDYPSVMDDPNLWRKKGPVFFCAESAKVWG